MTSDVVDTVQLNEKLNELSRLTKHDYGTESSISILKYFDHLYAFQQSYRIINDALVRRRYAALCQPLFKYCINDVFQTDNIWHTVYYILHSLWNYTEKSPAMCQAVLTLFKCSISILHNLAQISELKLDLQKHNCVEILKKLTSDTSHDFIRALSYLTLSYIITEDERTFLENAEHAISFVLNALREATVAKDRRYNGLRTTELCNGLSKLSVCDKNKMTIYSDTTLSCIIDMLKQQNFEEQCSASTLVWSLSFDESIRLKCYDNKELKELLCTINETTPNDELRRIVSGCLWTIMGNIKKKKATSPPSSASQKHVMISYNHDTKALSQKIKERLISDGYSVWIDFENMHINLLDAMAQAIEQAMVIIMCFTEKYKDSPSCRLEAEYAIQKNKKIVPLIAQANWKPTGWLGIILGQKLYINFAKKTFDIAYKEMLAEVKANTETAADDEQRRRGSAKPLPIESPVKEPIVPALSSNTTNTVEKLAKGFSNIKLEKSTTATAEASSSWKQWSANEVSAKLNEMGLERYQKIFVDVDGAKLTKLIEIKLKAPEFYYSLLKEKCDSLVPSRSSAPSIHSFSGSPLASQGNISTLAQFLTLVTGLDNLLEHLMTSN
ncbi:unnamed protein product [Didymodactylos carnosus]|uniref:TIR domain-containing protein n=1 Tax=Didymodactylos carnosus TaxID=1234261 RepID=A0A814JP00_9BILA|nr:unnamed protein product [Didymodactylos carnosus]CAF1040375.1 unnamed protein product [Didymodactylos carnosus]CAF3498176.1 unnamed protein product [Didymodactylos carnosus]CAF3810686.1 unnamed protein product [Didymodactylos carnosus]